MLLGNLPNVYIYAGVLLSILAKVLLCSRALLRLQLQSHPDMVNELSHRYDSLLAGDQPLRSVVVRAANNPSESIIAKRRGYGTIVSHNVPPYGRAGLYKQLAELQAMVTEYREDLDGNRVLRRPILAALQSAGDPFCLHGLADLADVRQDLTIAGCRVVHEQVPNMDPYRTDDAVAAKGLVLLHASIKNKPLACNPV